ncbi:hypothetical protein OROMI_011934 [Orobanche minor]
MVDMLGGAGYLDEALAFIKKMPIEPSSEIWTILMDHSRVHLDSELAERCYELVKISDSSRFGELAKQRLIQIKLPVVPEEKRKMLGYGLVDISSKRYGFTAGDTSHPDHEKFYAQLWSLRKVMIDAGYLAEMKYIMHDVDEESKDYCLLGHSERLISVVKCTGWELVKASGLERVAAFEKIRNETKTTIQRDTPRTGKSPGGPNQLIQTIEQLQEHGHYGVRIPVVQISGKGQSDRVYYLEKTLL